MWHTKKLGQFNKNLQPWPLISKRYQRKRCFLPGWMQWKRKNLLDPCSHLLIKPFAVAMKFVSFVIHLLWCSIESYKRIILENMTVNLHNILVSAIQNINKKEGNSNLSCIMLIFWSPSFQVMIFKLKHLFQILPLSK